MDQIFHLIGAGGGGAAGLEQLMNLLKKFDNGDGMVRMLIYVHNTSFFSFWAKLIDLCFFLKKLKITEEGIINLMN